MMKRSMLSFLLISFLAVTSLVSAADDDIATPLDVKLGIISGQVKLTRVGKTLSDLFSQGFPVYHGDIIETMRESKAELVYGDGTIMRLKPLTKVEIQATSLKVFKGQSWFKFTKRGSEFVVETPSLVAGIRGTVFDVAVTSRGKSVVSVMQGRVAVRGKSGGDEVVLDNGKASHCEVGKEPVKAYDFDVAKKSDEWLEVDWDALGVHNSDAQTRYITYLNLKSEYGENDSRTVEALKLFEQARKKKPDVVLPKPPKKSDLKKNDGKKAAKSAKKAE